MFVFVFVFVFVIVISGLLEIDVEQRRMMISTVLYYTVPLRITSHSCYNKNNDIIVSPWIRISDAFTK